MTSKRKFASVLLQLVAHCSESVRLPEATSGVGALWPLMEVRSVLSREASHPGLRPRVTRNQVKGILSFVSLILRVFMEDSRMRMWP